MWQVISQLLKKYTQAHVGYQPNLTSHGSGGEQDPRDLVMNSTSC